FLRFVQTISSVRRGGHRLLCDARLHCADRASGAAGLRKDANADTARGRRPGTDGAAAGDEGAPADPGVTRATAGASADGARTGEEGATLLATPAVGPAAQFSR